MTTDEFIDRYCGGNVTPIQRDGIDCFPME